MHRFSISKILHKQLRGTVLEPNAGAAPNAGAGAGVDPNREVVVGLAPN